MEGCYPLAYVGNLRQSPSGNEDLQHLKFCCHHQPS